MTSLLTLSRFECLGQKSQLSQSPILNTSLPPYPDALE